MTDREPTTSSSRGVLWCVAAIVAIVGLSSAGVSSASPGARFVAFSSYSLDLGACSFGGSICSAPFVETNVSDQTLVHTAGGITGPFQVIESECVPRTGSFEPGVSCVYVVALSPGTPSGKYHGRVCFDYAEVAPARICIRVSAELVG